MHGYFLQVIHLSCSTLLVFLFFAPEVFVASTGLYRILRVFAQRGVFAHLGVLLRDVAVLKFHPVSNHEKNHTKHRYYCRWVDFYLLPAP